METELEVTGDGSHTLYNPELKEHYHSTFGAVTESKTVFTGAGLGSFPDHSTVEILEVGFGTGLNAYLTLAESVSRHIQIIYTAIEPFPLPELTIERLNYPGISQSGDMAHFFTPLHTSPSGSPVQITPGFSLLKIRETVQDAILHDNRFQLVYFDAFGPDVQPELWTAGIFRKIASSMPTGGILVTYSVKGTVRRALKEAGFAVQKLPGPPGKREITKAVKL